MNKLVSGQEISIKFLERVNFPTHGIEFNEGNNARVVFLTLAGRYVKFQIGRLQFVCLTRKIKLLD